MASKFRAAGLVSTGSIESNGDLILTGGIYMTNGSGDEVNWESETNFVLSAQNSIQFKLDSDNDTSGAQFMITDHAGNTQHIFYEDGRAIFNNSQNSPGSLSVKGSTDLGLFLADLNNNVAGLGSTTNVIVGRPGIGTDVKVLLSGTVGSLNTSTRGTTLNAGDLVVSGATHLRNVLSVTGSIETTGDISLLADNNIRFNNPGQNDQFINGNNTTITLDADDGIVMKADSYIYHMIASDATYTNIFDSSKTIFNFNSEDIDFRVNTDDYQGTLFIDGNDNTIILGNQDFDASPTAAEVSGYGADVKLYLSGTAGSKDSATRGVTLLAGDLVASGATHLQSNLFVTGNIFAGPSEGDFTINSEGNIRLNVDSNNSSNEIFEVTANSTEYLKIEETVGTVFNGGNLSQSNFRVQAQGGNSAIFVDAGENAIALGWNSDSTPHWSELTETGTDVKIVLSGTVGSKGTGTRGTTLVAGDMMVSGAVGVNSINMTSDGKLGIGMNSPAYKLEVGGNAAFGEYLYHRGNTDTHLRFETDKITLTAGTMNGLSVIENGTSSEVVVNDGSVENLDFRVETNNNTHQIYADSGFDLLVLGSDQAVPPGIGSDTNVFTSGSIGSQGVDGGAVAVFGGDVYVSGSLYAKQRQVMTTADNASGTSEFFLSIHESGQGATSFQSRSHQFLAPFAGTVKKIMLRSDVANSTSINVKVYSSAGQNANSGGTSTTTAIGPITQHATIQDDIGHGFTEGQAIAVSVQRDPAPGNIQVTLVVEYNIHS